MSLTSVLLRTAAFAGFAVAMVSNGTSPVLPASGTPSHPMTKPSTPSSLVPPPYTTTTQKTVLSYTVICPTPTTVVEKDQTYTATTSGETLTITNCPCVVPATTVLTPGLVASETQYHAITSKIDTLSTSFAESTTIKVVGPSSSFTYTAQPHQTLELTNGPYTIEKNTPSIRYFTPEATRKPTVAPSIQPFTGAATRHVGPIIRALALIATVCFWILG